ncbi:conserved membrane hypothetical protein [Gammaproteobacteria bacterium]
MSYTSVLLGKGRWRLLFFQVVIISFIGCLVAINYGYYSALSILYGGFISMLVAWLLVWRLQKMNASTKVMTGFGVMHIYIGMVERFLLVALGMGVGMGWLHLPPFLIIVGFAAAQLAYVFN